MNYTLYDYIFAGVKNSCALNKCLTTECCNYNNLCNESAALPLLLFFILAKCICTSNWQTVHYHLIYRQYKILNNSKTTFDLNVVTFRIIILKSSCSTFFPLKTQL